MRDYIVSKLNAKTVKVRTLKQHNGSDVIIEVLMCENGKEITLIYDDKSGEAVLVC